MKIIYQVTQNLTRLFGTYVTTAVVVAESAKKAGDALIEYCRDQNERPAEDEPDVLVIQRWRLKYKKLGTADERTPLGVVCLETGADNDEPGSDTDATPEDEDTAVCPGCKQTVAIAAVRANRNPAGVPACPECGYVSGDHDGVKPTSLHREWEETFPDEDGDDKDEREGGPAGA